MPSLLVNKDNKYLGLDIEGVDDQVINKVVLKAPSDLRPRVQCWKWEQKLPEQYIVAGTKGRLSIKLSVQIQTMDTGEKFRLWVLVDSRATRLFINSDYVWNNWINMKSLAWPIPVNNVDGTPNEQGLICMVVELMLTYEGHSEWVVFAVACIGKEDMILGLPWLRQHNPEIDWNMGKIKMTQCLTHCNTYQAEVQVEKQIRQAEEQLRNKCRVGPFPLVVEDDDTDEENVDQYEEGDRIFMTVIQAIGNFLQQLAEAHHKNSTPKEPSNAVPPHFQHFTHVFAKESFDTLPEQKQWDHAIELIPDAKLSNCKVYPMSVAERVELDCFILENLETGQIRPSKSPMASPCFFIKKKDGLLRLIQDYQTLNSVTVKNHYPLLLITELVDRLQKAKYFTKLDVWWGYNNVQLKDGDKWKAAFRTNCRLFELLVMMFGLMNAPATFQTMMNNIFADLVAEGKVCVYLDNILIFMADMAEHWRTTEEVLQWLWEHKLFLKPEKCEFECQRIEYLRLIISKGRIEIDPMKVGRVAEWPRPNLKKEVQQFVGFVNFYWCFVKDYSTIARPLFNLIGNIDFRWGEEQEKAFLELKGRITSAPILALPDKGKLFQLEVDSSNVATRAVLSQQSESDGKWHPVAFYSKALSAVKRNYDIYDKEMLAIIHTLEEWHHFLEGTRHPFKVWMDHKNLEYFRSTWKLNQRQAYWSLYLLCFDFSLHYKPGHTMGKPDALSQRADHGDGSRDNSNTTLLKPELFAICTLEGITVEGLEKDIVGEIWKQNAEWMWEDSITVMVNKLKDTKANSVHSVEWKLQDGILYYQDKIYVLNNVDLWQRVLEQHHDSKIAGHPGRWKMLELMSCTYWWPCMSKFVRLYCSTCDLCLYTKPQWRAPIRELQPLLIPAERWDTISVDFVVELPESQGHDAIMVVVDSVCKCIHIIPMHTTVTASGTVQLFLHHIWKLHRLPKNVISNCGPQFIVAFMSELYWTLGIQMSTSTAYHPQTDGQMECVNQELEQYLQLFVNQRQNDWVDLLPMVEFQYNNHIHASA